MHETEIARSASKVRAFIGGRVRSASDADDLAQETLLKAFRGRHALREEARLEAWLYRVARRNIIDYYRDRRPQEELKETAAAMTDARLALVTESVTRSALCYLNTLPEEYRRAVLMADYENLPHAEIAKRLGISLSAVKSRVRRGRQRVRELMEDCCKMVYDARGKVVDYELRRQACPRADCAEK